MFLRQGVLRWLSAVLAFSASLPANAYLFPIDQFFVQRLDGATGALIFSFNDTFSDGAEPPSAPNFSTGVAASYFVTGTPFGVEADDKLTLNGSAAGPFVIGIGRFEGALLLTNITPGSDFGLRQGSVLTVFGIFDLVPPAAGEGYGVRLTDATASSNGDDDARIAIRRTPGGDVAVVFTETDLTASTITLIDFHELTAGELGSTQVLLGLTVDALGNVTGGYQFSGEPLSAFANTMTIFNGETFTRAGFFANAPIPTPLPGTFWLTMLGLAVLGLAIGKRKVRNTSY